MNSGGTDNMVGNGEHLEDALGGEPDNEGGPQHEQQNSDEIHRCSPPQHGRSTPVRL